MLPVVLDSSIKFDVRKDTTTFKSVVRAKLQELIKSEEAIPEGLFDKLLADRRVLVILDGLSEMQASPADGANPQSPHFPANALVITSRDEAREFGPNPVIEPQRIDSNHLLPFINTYMTAAGQVEITDSDLFDATRRLAELVTMETGITPLLAKLFAEQLAGLQKSSKPVSDLPRSVPDLMLAYLNTLNRDRTPLEPDNADIHKAAKIAAWECLSETFKPGQLAPKDRIRTALASVGLGAELLETLETRLRVVKTVQPAMSHVQFLLDPLTEYLAALHVVEKLRGDERAWVEWLQVADGKAGAPESIRGFLVAVRDTCLARTDLRIPDRIVDELAKRIGLDSEKITAARQRQRIHRLVKSLDSDESEDRIFAARQLGEVRIWSQEGFVALTKALQHDPDFYVRSAAASSLGFYGTTAGPILISALSDRIEKVRRAAVRAIALIAPLPEAIQILIDKLSFESAENQIEILTALPKVGRKDPRVVSTLLDAAYNASSLPEVREAAIKNLEDCDLGIEPIIRLIQLVDQAPETARSVSAATWFIAQGNEDSFLAVANDLDHRSERFALTVVGALEATGPAAIPMLQGIAEGDSRFNVRKQARIVLQSRQAVARLTSSS
jgi:HEAT repeat protein